MQTPAVPLPRTSNGLFLKVTEAAAGLTSCPPHELEVLGRKNEGDEEGNLPCTGISGIPHMSSVYAAEDEIWSKWRSSSLAMRMPCHLDSGGASISHSPSNW